MIDDVSNEWKRILERLRTAIKGEFEIVQRIGSGGMAAVYLARETALNRRVAIKIMSPALLTGPGMVARFKREANTIAALDHPNIITIHRVGDVDDLHFLVMKFVEGRSLEQIIQETGPLSVPVARGLLYMVGNALGHAHQRQVVHRDVKPANILIDCEGNAVVTDFGIAKAVGTERSADSEIMGTAAYMSPEQCYDQPVTAATDQYSLGVVAYQMVTGVLPFRGSLLEVMEGHAKRPPPPIKPLRADCPPELAAGIMRMLAKEPSKRWPSMKQALAELGAAPLFPDHPARLALAKLGKPDGKGRQATESAPQAHVSSLSIPAPPAWIEAGDELILRASAKDWAGDTMPGIAIRWRTDTPAIAKVDEKTGIVGALAPGTVTITATFEQLQCNVVLQVVPRRVAAVTVSAPPDPIHVGDPPVRLVPRLEDKARQELKRPVAWMTDDSRIAAISDTGSLRGVGPGSTHVYAEAEGVRGGAEVRVAPARVVAVRPTTAPASLVVGGEVTLGAMPLDARGLELPDREVTWMTSDPDVATITAEGLVTARAPGHVTLSCFCEGSLAFIELEVEAAAPILDVTPIERSGTPLADEDLIIRSPEADLLSSGEDEAGKAVVEPAIAPDLSIPSFESLFGKSVDEESTATSSEVATTKPDVEALVGEAAVSEAPVGETPVGEAPVGEAEEYEPPEAPVAAVATDPPKRPSRWRPRRALVVGGGLALVLVAVAALAWDSKRKSDIEKEKLEQARQDSLHNANVAAAAADSARRDSVARIPASIEITSRRDTLRVGASDTLVAVVKNSTNNALPDSVRWRSKDVAVAIIDSVTGVVRARRPGAVEIVAAVGALEQPISITVAPRLPAPSGNGGTGVKTGQAAGSSVSGAGSGPCQGLGKEIGAQFNRMLGDIKDQKFGELRQRLQPSFVKELEDSTRAAPAKSVVHVHCRDLTDMPGTSLLAFNVELDAVSGKDTVVLIHPRNVFATLEAKGGPHLTNVGRTRP